MMPFMNRFIRDVAAATEGLRGNDEARMTNDELESYTRPFLFGISHFVIPSSFVIRRSSFNEGSHGALRQPRDDSAPGIARS
jgi:hypothetical protein